jgi:membrane-associated phospholipid phosphatase
MWRVCLVILLLIPAESLATGTDSTAIDDGWSLGRVWNDSKKGVWLFVTDAGAVVTKPARMQKNDYIWLGELLVGGAILFAFDEDIDRAVQENKDNPVVKGISNVGDTFQVLGLMGKTNRYYIGGIVVGYFTGWKPLQRISSDILFSHWIAGLYRNAFKIVVGRSRPNEDLGAYNFEFNSGGTSLPSGHSSTIMQLATIASRYTNWWPASVVYYGIAGCVCFQRIETREHWASDVWIGALNGTAIARLVMREHDDKGIIWVPSYIPETNTVGLYLQKNF